MSEENAIRVIEGQPEVAAIEIPHEAGRDPRCRLQNVSKTAAELRGLLRSGAELVS